MSEAFLGIAKLVSVYSLSLANPSVADAGEMSGKSVTELVSNFRRPFEGEGHVWLATRGPGEFVGEYAC